MMLVGFGFFERRKKRKEKDLELIENMAAVGTWLQAECQNQLAEKFPHTTHWTMLDSCVEYLEYGPFWKRRRFYWISLTVELVSARDIRLIRQLLTQCVEDYLAKTRNRRDRVRIYFTPMVY